MNPYSLSHVADHDLLRSLTELNDQDRATKATLQALRAEAEARKLCLPEADDDEAAPALQPALGSEHDRAEIIPLPDGRFELRWSLDQDSYDQLRHALTLMGLGESEREVAKAIKFALRMLIEGL